MDDLTVYDLAERIAAGLPMSSLANQEVAAELLRVLDLLQAFGSCDGDVYRFLREHKIPT